MSELLTARDGIPRFAERLRNCEPSTIVAFGTSMTLFGQYLAKLPSALANESRAPVTLLNRGLRGFVTFAGAFRLDEDVLPHRPDLLLIEFAHNDSSPDAIDNIAPALDSMIARMRAVNPECEFAFVLLAPAGVAAAGPSTAMRIYEEVAGYYRFPSFDLATLSEEIVAAGRAPWSGEGGLTHDGIHHTEVAADLIGGSFAAAFIELLRASDRPVSAPRRVLDRSLLELARTPVAAHRTAGEWLTGTPPNHDVRNCEAYDEVAAEPKEPGAAFRIRFTGTRVFLWAMGNGALETSIEGSGLWNRVQIASGPAWSFHTISPTLPPGPYVLEVRALELPLVLGDVFIIGRLTGGTAGPAVVK